jgi:dTDP-4-amino-4,6-dideoxygalactose transaminase
MTELGYNYRLTDFQCALGSSQLKKLDSFVRRRRELAALYDHLFAQLADLRCPVQLPTFFHAYHLYILRIAFDSDHMSRKDFFAQCLERGVRLQVHYRPVVQNSYYAGRPVNIDALERLPVSIAAYRESISLPIYPHLEDSDVSSVAQTIIDLRTHVSRRADSPSNTPTSL